MADKYDEAIEIITQHRLQLDDVEFGLYVRGIWTNPYATREACLFQYAGSRHYHREDMWCGCLTQIRSGVADGRHHAQTTEITEAIKADERIPKLIGDITLESLPVFAEWQRKLDKEYERV